MLRLLRERKLKGTASATTTLKPQEQAVEFRPNLLDDDVTPCRFCIDCTVLIGYYDYHLMTLLFTCFISFQHEKRELEII